MNRWRRCRAVSAVVLALFLAGCGGGIFRSSKTINDPLALNGRSATINVVHTGDALTRQFTVDPPANPTDPAQALLAYTFGNMVSSGSPLQPYEGMESLDFSQKVRLRFQFTPNTGMPDDLVLRNVNLQIVLRLKDTAPQGGSRFLTPVELSYSGTLVLKRQVDGSYLPSNELSFTIPMDKQAGWSLLNVLASGSENTLLAALSLNAETSSTNVPSEATARLTVEFAEGSARVLW